MITPGQGLVSAMKVLKKVGDRGQVTIPKEIRELMEIDDGDIVEFEILAIHHPKKKRGKADAQSTHNATGATA